MVVMPSNTMQVSARLIRTTIDDFFCGIFINIQSKRSVMRHIIPCFFAFVLTTPLEVSLMIVCAKYKIKR